MTRSGITRSGALQNTISQRYGLRPNRDWSKSIELAISELARERQVSPQVMESELYVNARLLREIAGRLTVEETFFFRFPAQIEFVVGHLSRLLAQGTDKTVTVWSAGCSSGEEPYSVAIGLQQRLGTVPARATIVGCDINAVAIERAKIATYGKWSFRGVPEELRKRCFERADDDKYRLHETLRGSVQFEHLAIEEAAQRFETASVHAVLFRNVGVYFDGSALERCFRQFHRVLAPDGLLVLAATDPTPPKQLFARVAGSVGIYRRAKQAEKRPHSRALDGQPKGTSPTQTVERSPQTLRPPPKVEALALGDRGHLLHAIEAVNRSAAADPTDAQSFLLRGQLLLADGQAAAATEDFRRVLFLKPNHRLARYWYITTLHVSEQTKRVRAQVAELHRQLAQAPDNALLEDGTTTVRELRAALTTFQGLYE